MESVLASGGVRRGRRVDQRRRPPRPSGPPVVRKLDEEQTELRVRYVFD